MTTNRKRSHSFNAIPCIEAASTRRGAWCSGDYYDEGSNRGSKKSRKTAEHGSFDREGNCLIQEKLGLAEWVLHHAFIRCVTIYLAAALCECSGIIFEFTF